ncbi:hypothetical protein [Streptomyces syringium]|uniref:hypothetical protein n=1 Tax=Streptomyces syringium TaxID=76729 RepID=UPI0037CFF8E8
MDAERHLADRMRAASEAQLRLQQGFERFDEVRGEVESVLGHGDGLPAKAVRAQLQEAGELWNWFHESTALYERMRRLWSDLDGSGDLEAVAAASEYFSEHCDHCASHVAELDGAINSFLELRSKLVELREKVAPIRERAHTSLAAAKNELEHAVSVQGRFALTARLNAVSDRLSDLDAGNVEPDPNRKVTDWYRDVETEIAEIRDAVPRSAY